MPEQLGDQRPRNLWLGVAVSFLICLAVRLLFLPTANSAGSVDGAYYYAVAENLVTGRGFVVDYQWNYLRGHPTGLPVPSNEFWMPITSILMAPFIGVLGPSLRCALWSPVLLASFLGAVTFLIARDLSRRSDVALLAALLWAISDRAIAYSLSPDCFMASALPGAIALYATYNALWVRPTSPAAAAAGLCAGIAYLARTDAVLLIGAFIICAIIARRRAACVPIAAFVAGWLVSASPWLVRNIVVFGTPTPVPLAKLSCMTSYTDMFRLDTSGLTWDNYVAQGWGELLRVRGIAVRDSALRLCRDFGPALAFALGSAAVPGVRRAALPHVLALALMLLIGPLVVPLLAMRGWVGHAAPQLMPFTLAAACCATTALLQRLMPRQIALVTAAALLAAYPLYHLPGLATKLRESRLEYERDPLGLTGALADLPATEPVMTDDPWELWLLARRPCYRLPTDDPETALSLAESLGIRRLVATDVMAERELVAGLPSTLATDERIKLRSVLARARVYDLRFPRDRDAAARALNAAGMRYAREGRHVLAARTFFHALERKGDPTFAPLLANIARASRDGGRPEEAVEFFRRATGSVPKDVGLRVEFGDVLARLGRDSEAHEQWQAAVDADLVAAEKLGVQRRLRSAQEANPSAGRAGGESR